MMMLFVVASYKTSQLTSRNIKASISLDTRDRTILNRFLRGFVAVQSQLLSSSTNQGLRDSTPSSSDRFFPLMPINLAGAAPRQQSLICETGEVR